MSEEEKTIEDIKKIINRCKECKFATCEQCEINWTQIKTVEHLLDLYNKEKEKNEILEDTLNNSIDIRKYWISKDKIKEVADDYESKGYIEIAGAMRELLEERN